MSESFNDIFPKKVIYFSLCTPIFNQALVA